MKLLALSLLSFVLLTDGCNLSNRRQSGAGGESGEDTSATSQTGPANTSSMTTRAESAVDSAAFQPTQQSTDKLATTKPVSSTTPVAPQPALAAANSKPYPWAPECADHDDTQWHGLWNPDDGCHYYHTHNADPFATEFAERVAAWEQTISYPWQTPDENAMKHQGYKYAYTVDSDCSERRDAMDNCIRASLIQLHAIGSQAGIIVRFHSYRAVALISEGINDEPGFIELGGHSDFGILHCPYKKVHCPLPTDPRNSNYDQMWPHPPYRASASLDRLMRDLSNGRITQLWNSGWQPIVGKFYPAPYNLLFEYDFHSADAWGPIDSDDPTELHLVCPDGDCPNNHSTLRVYEIVIRVPEELAGPSGRVDYAGFTDVQGNIDGSCTEVGPECVPLIIDNVPVGSATFRLPVAPIPLTAFPDYDIYFDGRTSGWIQYPN